MRDYLEQMEYYSEQCHRLSQKKSKESDHELPGRAYFLEDGSILCLPREDGDSRFPYGENGFNFWTYASGYMHANEGLFSPFLRASEGQEPKIAFFAGWKEGENYQVLSLLAVPKLADEPSMTLRYTVFTKNDTYYITEVKELLFAIRVFVNNENHMYFTITVHNRGIQERKIFLSPYLNPFLCNSIYENSEHRWFRKGEFMENNPEDLGRFLFSTNEDISRTVSVTNLGVINQGLTLNGNQLIKREATTSRYQYVGGTYRSLHTPEALIHGTFGEPKHVTAFQDVAIAGELLQLSIRSNSYVRLDMEVCYLVHSKSMDHYQKLIHSLEPSMIDKLVEEKVRQNEQESGSLQAVFHHPRDNQYNSTVLTNFFDYLKKQVEFCSLIKGYVQLSEGSLIGIRDVFQALEGMLFYKPEQSRKKMIEALGFIAPNGRCPRQYSLPISENAVPAMDLRQFIDQGVWVINTIVTYLKFTSDFEFLKEHCGYYEIIDDKRSLVQKSDLTDSVLSHMLRIMDYLISNQDEDTGCIHALYGDWNDALDGLGVSKDGSREFGSGVSVMATLQVYQNLKDMMELLRMLEGYVETLQRYQQSSERIEHGLQEYAVIQNENGEKRIVHGWGDARSYLVGSFCDPDHMSRQGLTSNAFWVISGMQKKDDALRETILKAFDDLDSCYGLKTFEPYFMPDTPGVGRIYKLPPGTAENGATYIHATAFGIMALFQMGEAKRAWEQLRKILPFTHSHLSCTPFVMPNSYGHNPALNIDGESMNDWQTGSSNVVFKILLWFAFGFMPEYGGFFLQPASYLPFENYELKICYQNSRVNINYSNKGFGTRRFYLNASECKTIWDEEMKIYKIWVAQSDLSEIVTIVIED